MPNTQVPPEVPQGTFSAYYREALSQQLDWYNTLTQEQRFALDSIVFHHTGWGQCGCGRGGRFYAYSRFGNVIIDGKCARCIRNFVVNHDEVVYLIYARYSLDTIMPASEFPPDTSERQMCVCGEFIFHEDDDVMSRLVQSTYSHRGSATDEPVLIHKACSFECNMCHESFVAVRRSDTQFYNGRKICSDCAIVCSEADDVHSCDNCEYYFDETFYSEWRQRDLCQECYNEEVECNECGHWTHENSMDDHECYRDNSGIYDYSYKPRPTFYGQDDYHFGIELEVENRDGWGCGAGAEIVYDTLGERVYCKHDGSLDDGFEIVSHPHSIAEIQNLNWNFLRTLRNRGFRSWDTNTCGLHVHVSRTAFRNNGKRDEAHELRFQKLIYDNSAQVCAIAGRTSSYARFMDKGNLVPKVKYGQSADRYEAINIQNDHTLEIRVFKGSLKKERILSAVEFIHSAIEYTRNMKINPRDKQFSWIRFMAYVLDNQTKYSNFVQVALSSLDKPLVSSHIDEENN
jgi:hypothetical protein